MFGLLDYVGFAFRIFQVFLLKDLVIILRNPGMRWKRTCELDFFSRASPADSLYEVPKPFNAFNLSRF